MDPSSFAIGRVLNQDGRLVAFESAKMENNWPTHEQEMHVVVYCLKQWEIHLICSPKFVVYTDNITCKYFSDQERLTGKLMRWQQYLAKFYYEMVYKPGKENVVADALTRKEQYLRAVWNIESEWPDLVLNAYTDDALARTWLAIFKKKGSVPHVTLEHGLLKWKQTRVYIPAELRQRVLAVYHDLSWVGHGG
ncbi:ribonuclease H family protein [Acinetobacter pittii]|uniref:Ty3/Gypsy family RNase HI domain-containing protein n=1 Tax=Acinetobacter pittii TaxID=48296 RepID=UPI00374F50E9